MSCNQYVVKKQLNKTPEKPKTPPLTITWKYAAKTKYMPKDDVLAADIIDRPGSPLPCAALLEAAHLGVLKALNAPIGFTHNDLSLFPENKSNKYKK
jgi:hypothetical protein